MHDPIHKRFMSAALKCAERGIGKTGHNPAVGAVIVKGNRVIAKGYHSRFGASHAEVIALNRAGRRAKDATLYLTLEPCSHSGKTPPCTEAIICSGIKKVVCAMEDPNPVNKGRGFKLLRLKDISVISGILKSKAELLNREFIRRMKKGRPFITVKIAQSLDGKIATKTGDSKWISSPRSRSIVQGLRKNHDAVLVGINTLITDDPLLSVRGFKRQPVKIILDTDLRTPENAKIFSRYSTGRVIIVTSSKSSVKKEEHLKRKGAEIIRMDAVSGRIEMKAILKRLLNAGINSILVEGGGEVVASLLEQDLADKILFFMAPILIGGRDAKTSFEGSGIKNIRAALKLGNMKHRSIGKDILIEADVYRNS